MFQFNEQVKQMAQKDERVKVMNEVLSGIKVIIHVHVCNYSCLD